MNRTAIIPVLEKAGYPEGYQIYLELLDVKGNKLGGASYGMPIAQLAVNEVLQFYATNDVALQKVRELKDVEQQRLEVRRWVEAKTNSRK